jgi:hypothetical protein
MKRFRLAVLLAFAVALLGTPAIAGKWYIRSYTVALTPTGVEPGASGKATLEDLVFSDDGEAYLTVSCKGLTPGATYCVRVWIDGGLAWTSPFTATRQGGGEAGGAIPFWWYFPAAVEVVNVQEVAVLTGTVR